ncbi:MAG: hypothetical protein BRC29_02595 [Nanohaloarchaea archaeon SW_7_43_1]|nr:MAG: hypothetical protein BRC29_02595 [Nanohaloarchaea archaeon SW_7_43_1]
MKKYVKLYLSYLKQYLKSRLVYKSDFILGTVGQMVNVAVSLAFLGLVFTKVETLQGWSFEEMLFLAGFSSTVLYIHNIFLFNIYRLGEKYIVKGNLDRVLLRPLNPLFQIYADDFRDNNIPKLIASIGLIVYSSAALGLSLTSLKFFYGLASLVSGVLVVAAIYLTFASTAFWTGKSKNVIWLFFRISDFRRYPFDIFSLAIQVMLVTLIPLGFASFFPASFLLGKPGWETWKLLTPIAGPVLYLFAYQFWKLGLASYSSTGT